MVEIRNDHETCRTLELLHFCCHRGRTGPCNTNKQGFANQPRINLVDDNCMVMLHLLSNFFDLDKDGNMDSLNINNT